MKIWAKVMRGDKILRDVIYEGEHKATFSGFREAVQSAAYLSDGRAPAHPAGQTTGPGRSSGCSSPWCR